MKKYIVFILIALMTSVVVFAGGNFLSEKLNNKKIANVGMGGEYTFVAGVIRNYGNGWILIQDSTHETINITGVSQDESKIIVGYPENAKVNSIAVTPDETMASEGYTVGASVGISETWISIYDKNGNTVNPLDYTNQSGNIWIQGIFKK